MPGPTKAGPSPKEKELQQQIKNLQKERDQLAMKVQSQKTEESVSEESKETKAVIQALQKEVEALKQQTAVVPQVTQLAPGQKPPKRQPKPEEVLDKGEAVTFTARCVMKVIAGYQDPETGIEVAAPYGRIVLRHASSDIRQDGPEETIIHFCSYTSFLKPEVEFLRSHPEYGITFFDNMNDAAVSDPKEYQFRARLATEIRELTSEGAVQWAQDNNVPGWAKMSVKQLKERIMQEQLKKYVQESQALQNELTAKLIKQAEKAQERSQ